MARRERVRRNPFSVTRLEMYVRALLESVTKYHIHDFVLVVVRSCLMLDGRRLVIILRVDAL